MKRELKLGSFLFFSLLIWSVLAPQIVRAEDYKVSCSLTSPVAANVQPNTSVKISYRCFNLGEKAIRLVPVLNNPLTGTSSNAAGIKIVGVGNSAAFTYDNVRVGSSPRTFSWGVSMTDIRPLRVRGTYYKNLTVPAYSADTGDSGGSGGGPTTPAVAATCVVKKSFIPAPFSSEMSIIYTLTNTGTTTWTPTVNTNTEWRVGLIDPIDSSEFGPTFQRATIGETVAPGQSVDVELKGRLVSEKKIRHALIKEGSAWYGATASCPEIQLQYGQGVTAGTCTVVQKLVATVPGQPISVTYRLTNTGSRLWTQSGNDASDWRVGLYKPLDDRQFGDAFQRATLSKDVNPGESIDVTLSGTAQAISPGTIEHRLLREGEFWSDIACPPQNMLQSSPTNPEKILVNPCYKTNQYGTHSFTLRAQSPSADGNHVYLRFMPRDGVTRQAMVVDAYNLVTEDEVSTAKRTCDQSQVTAFYDDPDNDQWQYMQIQLPAGPRTDYLDIHLDSGLVAVVDAVYYPTEKCASNQVDVTGSCVVLGPGSDDGGSQNICEFTPQSGSASGSVTLQPCNDDETDGGAYEGTFYLFNQIPLFIYPSVIPFDLLAVSTFTLASISIILGFVVIGLMLAYAFRAKLGSQYKGISITLVVVGLISAVLVTVSAGSTVVYELDRSNVTRGSIETANQPNASAGSSFRLQ